jgi:hypothetical protein
MVTLAATGTDKISIIPAIFTIKITISELHIVTMMKLVTTLAFVPTTFSAAIGTEQRTLAISEIVLFKPLAASLTLLISAILCTFLANYLIANLGTNIKGCPTYGA